MIKVSVIIPVYNEEKHIEKCLNSLINQTYPINQMEWIFIDGNSNDKTVDCIKKYIAKYPIKILHNKKRKTPISINMGIKDSLGDYIIRFDAHSEFKYDYIDKCVRYLESGIADNVGGVIETKAYGFIGNAISKVLSSKFGVGESKFRIGSESGYVDTVPFGAFKKDLFNRIGYFNEDLLRSEDNEFNSRIRKNGGRVYLANDIQSIYYCRSNIRDLLKMALLNGNSLFRTLKYDKHAMGIRHFIPFFFLLSLIIMPILSLNNKFFKICFIAELCSYLGLDVYYSFINKTGKEGIASFFIFPLFHITYGIGSLLGLLGKELY